MVVSTRCNLQAVSTVRLPMDNDAAEAPSYIDYVQSPSGV